MTLILQIILNIDDDDAYHLEENHRNSKEIIEVAISFAPDELKIDISKARAMVKNPISLP